MQNNYGNLIKVERLRRNMKQSVLARGICSISYLSKIENNQTIPSEEVLELLFRKLDLDIPLYVTVTEAEIDKIKVEISRLMKEAVLSRDLNESADNLKKIERYKKDHRIYKHKPLYILMLLVLARFDFMPGGKQGYLTELEWLQDQFTSEDRIRFNILKALKSFSLNDKDTALDLMQQVREDLDTTYLEDWEIADINYIIGGMYYKYTDYLQTIEHVNRALSYFKDNFYVERVIECHLIIGLAFKRRKRFNEALANYQKAIKAAGATDLKGYYGMLYNNTGEIYSLQGNRELALEYFLKGLEYKVESKSKLLSILSLIEEYSIRGSSQEVLSWVEKGEKIIQEEGENDNLSEFIYHFGVFRNKYTHGNSKELIESLKKAVQYFESSDDYHYTNKYALWLARELRENGKYKLSTEYYEKSIAIMSRWD